MVGLFFDKIVILTVCTLVPSPFFFNFGTGNNLRNSNVISSVKLSSLNELDRLFTDRGIISKTFTF